MLYSCTHNGNSGCQRVKIVHTAPCPHYLNPNVFSHCPNLSHDTISPPLSSAMEDCFIVRVQQLRMFCHRRCCMSTSQCMFVSLWNVVVAHEHQRQTVCVLSIVCWTAVIPTSTRHKSPKHISIRLSVCWVSFVELQSYQPVLDTSHQNTSASDCLCVECRLLNCSHTNQY